MNLETLARTVGDIADPTQDRLLAGRHQLDREIEAARVRVTVQRRNRQKRRWGISSLAGAAAAAAAAMIVVPLITAAPASAREVLLAAADGASQQVNVAAGAEYWYVRSEVDDPATAPFEREIWQARTGQSIVRDQFLAAEAAQTAGSTTLDPALIRNEGGPAATFAVSDSFLTWQELDALPTDATALEALLRAEIKGAEAGDDNELWATVVGLLQESPASPALRRALWQVAATVPDVQLNGAMTDFAGRHGTALERNMLKERGYRALYILDPSDGTLLESQIVDKDGNVINRSTQLAQEPTDTAPTAQLPICGAGSVPLLSC